MQFDGRTLGSARRRFDEGAPSGIVSLICRSISNIRHLRRASRTKFPVTETESAV
jgi:hypothetical protein